MLKIVDWVVRIVGAITIFFIVVGAIRGWLMKKSPNRQQDLEDTEIEKLLRPLRPQSNPPQDTIHQFDHFDRKAFFCGNALLLGSPGSGKTYFMSFLVSEFLKENENNHVIIFANEGLYGRLCEKLVGDYFDLDLSGKYTINPMRPKEKVIRQGSDAEPNLDAEELYEITCAICKIIETDGQSPVTGKGQHIIELSLDKTYLSSVNDTPTLREFIGELSRYRWGEENEAAAKILAKRLEECLLGKWSKFLSGPTNIFPKSRLTVYEIGNEEFSDYNNPRFHEAILYLLKSVVNPLWCDYDKRKMIVFDEASRLFNSTEGSRIISSFSRSARPHNAMVYAASQSPADVLSDESGYLDNIGVRYILTLRNRFELLEKLGLNGEEIEAVKNLRNHSETSREIFMSNRGGLGLTDDKRVSGVFRFAPTPEEDELFTTNPKRYLKI